MTVEIAFAFASELSLKIGHLHNIAAKIDANVARRLYLDARQAFQKARCDKRRKKNYTKSLELFVLTSKKLCSLAEKDVEHQEIVLKVKRSISDMVKELL